MMGLRAGGVNRLIGRMSAASKRASRSSTWGGSSLSIEIKAASTWHAGLEQALLSFSSKIAPLSRKAVIYRGEPIEFSDGVLALSFTDTASLFGSRERALASGQPQDDGRLEFMQAGRQCARRVRWVIGRHADVDHQGRSNARERCCYGYHACLPAHRAPTLPPNFANRALNLAQRGGPALWVPKAQARELVRECIPVERGKKGPPQCRERHGDALPRHDLTKGFVLVESHGRQINDIVPVGRGQACIDPMAAGNLA